MADAAEAFGLAHRLMNEVSLSDAEAVPGIHFDRQDPDQGFDQPWPQRDSRGEGNAPPAAEGSDGFINGDGGLTHHHPAKSSLPRLPVDLMRLCGQITADPRDVGKSVPPWWTFKSPLEIFLFP